MRLYCLLGNQYVHVTQWEDVANKTTWKEEDEVFWTTLSDMMSASEFESTIDRLSSLPDVRTEVQYVT